MESLQTILKKYLQKEHLKFTNYLLYSNSELRELKLHSEAIEFARENNIELNAFSLIDSELSQRNVRVAVFQNKIVQPTNSPIELQRNSLLELGKIAIETAALCNVQMFCFQEIWNMPVAFCTQKKLPWTEFAEDALSGPTTIFLKSLAKKHSMVIISPILERDSDDFLWNSAVVINSDGNVLGISRKNHMPISGKFSEAYYYNSSEIGHPVFETTYGKVAVAICYERHHPQCWAMYSLNGAEIVFNPSATVSTFSESLWPIEARDAAVQNGFYTCAINRVGTEIFSNLETAGPFFGSCYISSPDGLRTPSISSDKNAILIADIDLMKCSSLEERRKKFFSVPLKF